MGGNILVRLMGTWDEAEGSSSGQMVPIWGLAYYVSPPANLSDIVTDPLHAIVYLVFILSACALFSKTWIEVSGSSSRDVAKQLRDQQMMFKGHRDTSLLHILDMYIPTAAAFGGMCIGMLTIF